MNINEVIDRKSQRIERKIMLSKGQNIFFKYSMKNEGFSSTYFDRKISSIYFDDASLSGLRDNIDGNKIRNKIRLRYYDNLIGKTNLEIKQKRGFLGYKHRIKIPNIYQNESDLIQYVNNWSKSELDNFIFPVSKITYIRSYFRRGPIRATIDVNINSHKLSSSGHKLFSSINDYEVIEFKYDSDYDSEFRTLYDSLKGIYSRSTKSSKYSNSMMY